MRGALVAVLCFLAFAGIAEARPVPFQHGPFVPPQPDVKEPRPIPSLRARIRDLERRLDGLLEAKRERAFRRSCRAPATIVVLGRCIQARGYTVGEHPSFGGVSPVHRGPCHYAGRALDVNDGAGESAAEMASLDRLNAYLKTLPRAWVLWRTAGHFNHLHVAYDCVG